MQIKQTLIGLATAIAISATSMSATAAESSWADKIKVSGDLRYRFENLERDDSEDRGRSRLRTRLNIKGEVNSSVKVGIRLATGSDDPISTNQTLDKFGSTKGIGVDRAYVTWTPANLTGSSFTAGKMATPFYRASGTQLLWDGDLNPEGLAYGYKNNGFFANVARLNLDECSSCDDSYLTGGQVGYTWKTANDSKLTFGLGAFQYDLNADEVGDAFEYSFNGNDFGLVDGFSLTEIFADYKTKLAGRPFTVHVAYVQNGDADKFRNVLDGTGTSIFDGVSSDFDSGYDIGFRYNKVKGAGDWEFRYNYKDVDLFAVFPIWADSDFGGGGSDNNGHQLDFRYGISKNFSVGLRHFINETAVSSESDNNPATNPAGYDRTFLDLNFKF